MQTNRGTASKVKNLDNLQVMMVKAHPSRESIFPTVAMALIRKAGIKGALVA
ncbi:MAG: hypothetical protein GDA56_07200 [Hormoscilla sp. GM7CHS1pb]|nr:hypothetical protein [Hormoscilla sp. GM7CHS1pb]